MKNQSITIDFIKTTFNRLLHKHIMRINVFLKVKVEISRNNRLLFDYPMHIFFHGKLQKNGSKNDPFCVDMTKREGRNA